VNRLAGISSTVDSVLIDDGASMPAAAVARLAGRQPSWQLVRAEPGQPERAGQQPDGRPVQWTARQKGPAVQADGGRWVVGLALSELQAGERRHAQRGDAQRAARKPGRLQRARTSAGPPGQLDDRGREHAERRGGDELADDAQSGVALALAKGFVGIGQTHMVSDHCIEGVEFLSLPRMEPTTNCFKLVHESVHDREQHENAGVVPSREVVISGAFDQVHSLAERGEGTRRPEEELWVVRVLVIVLKDAGAASWVSAGSQRCPCGENRERRTWSVCFGPMRLAVFGLPGRSLDSGCRKSREEKQRKRCPGACPAALS
jgi:hypothetical protein